MLMPSVYRHRRPAGLLVWCWLATGCGLGTDPQALYMQALHEKFSGNAKGYYDRMLALADEAPESRAGRRARATVVGDDRLSDFLLMGAGATFMGASDAALGDGDGDGDGDSNAGEALSSVEAQTQLRLIAAAQQRFFKEHGRYCTTFLECDTPAPVAAHYFYFLSEQTVAGGSDSEQTVDLEEPARLYLNARGIHPKVGGGAFLAVAIGMGASTEEFDVWTIDEGEHLVHIP